MSVRFALAGCGGMGLRHIYGFAELARARPDAAELAAVIDVAPDRAEAAAVEAEQHIGARPQAFTSLAEAVAVIPDLAAVDVVTTPETHQTIAVDAFDAGLHVLVEKPMGVTIRACDRIAAASARTERILSVAENYRRDPISRLALALLDGGALGELRTVLETHTAGADSIVITPWRHRRETGGPLMEIGVHFADMLIYLLGPVASVVGVTRLVERERVFRADASRPTATFYRRFFSEFPAQVAADAPDSLVAMLQFESGVAGQWVLDVAARGPNQSDRVILGSAGRMNVPRQRSGIPLEVWRDDPDSQLSDDDLLALVPDFHLDELTSDLFGGDRLARYDADFEQADRKLIALEIAELAAAIETGGAVEIGPDGGRNAVALVLAAVESGEAGRPVTLAEVTGGDVSAYQDPIDRQLGLLT